MTKAHEDFSRTHDVKTSSNRAFGWVFVAVFAFIGVFPLLSGGELLWWSVITCAVIFVITLLTPALLALPNRLWLRFGMLLHRIVSPIILAFLFYAVVTPMGLLMRAFGKDSLRLRSGKVHDSYWIIRNPPGPKPDSMNHQF